MVKTTTQSYERYTQINQEAYDKKGLSFFLLRKPSDCIILPMIQRYKGKNVLEVGLGYGYYSKYFLDNGCSMIGVDINPFMAKNIGIKVVEAAADDFKKFFKNEKFDLVASFWMTEYLNSLELGNFFTESYEVLQKGGIFMTTVISDISLGKIYTVGASLKGVIKYGYSMTHLLNSLNQFEKREIIALPGQFGLGFAYLIIAQK